METVSVDEGALPALLDRFYDRVRRDPDLGPVFDGAVGDWPAHLEKLAAFWSSIMLTSGRYKGNPVGAHLRHSARVTPEMFDRWLALWTRTTDEMLPPTHAAAMQTKARRIAESLKLALKLATPADRTAFFTKPQPYRSTPEFDETSLPAGLRRTHRTMDGVWGVIRVTEGSIRYDLEDGSDPILLTPDRSGLIRPQQPHHVEPVGSFRMQVDFYNAKPRLD